MNPPVVKNLSRFNFVLYLILCTIIFPFYADSQIASTKLYSENFPTSIPSDPTEFDKAVESLKNLGMVVGASYDLEKGLLTLIGSGEHPEASPSIYQIVTAFQWAFADSNRANFASIDPWPGNPYAPWMIVNLNFDAEDGEFGWIMFEADRLMKCYSLGEDNLTGLPVASEVAGFRNMPQITLAMNSGNRNDEEWSRFWLYPYYNEVEADTQSIRINKAFIGVRTEKMVLRGGKLVSLTGVSSPAADEFARFFTEHYPEFAAEEPVFRQLEQLMRLLLVSEWIRHPFLFKTKIQYQAELKKSRFPEELRKEFIDHSIQLSQNLRIEAEDDRRRFKVFDIGNDQVYCLELQEEPKPQSINVFRHQKIPIGLDWIARYREETYRLPRVTPALEVSRQDTQLTRDGALIRTMRFFGGTDLAIKANYLHPGQDFRDWSIVAIQNAPARVGQPSTFQYSNKTYYSSAFPASSPASYIPSYQLVLQQNLPNNLIAQLRRRRSLASSLHQLEEGWEVAIPALRSTFPEAREGLSRSIGIEGIARSTVEIRHYELYDSDGGLIGRFEKHEIDQANNRIVVLPTDATSSWRLYPQADGVVWASDRMGQIWAFDRRSGKFIGEQINDQVIQYKYNERGILTEISLGGQGIYIQHGNNGGQILSAKTSDGVSKNFIEPVPGLPKQFAKIYNELGQEIAVEIDANIGNWIWHSDIPETRSGTNFLSRHGRELGNLLALSNNETAYVSVIDDGGMSLVIAGKSVYVLPVNSNGLAKIATQAESHQAKLSKTIAEIMNRIQQNLLPEQRLVFQLNNSTLRRYFARMFSRTTDQPMYVTANWERAMKNMETIQNMETNYREIDVRIICESLEHKPAIKEIFQEYMGRKVESDMVVIVAHTTEEIEKQLLPLAPQLKDKVIILLNCGQPGEMRKRQEFYDRLIEEFGVRGILGSDYILDAENAKKLIDKMIENARRQDKARDPVELFFDSLQDCIQDQKGKDKKPLDFERLKPGPPTIMRIKDVLLLIC